MEAHDWRDMILIATTRHEDGDDDVLTLLARQLEEQEQAKDRLIAAGYGAVGMPWPDLATAILQHDVTSHEGD